MVVQLKMPFFYHFSTDSIAPLFSSSDQHSVAVKLRFNHDMIRQQLSIICSISIMLFIKYNSGCNHNVYGAILKLCILDSRPRGRGKSMCKMTLYVF